ncbi:IS110 family transposase [Micromonospora arborensis]|uniref:IS110 family transposase n=1 Tax=Micromonospora arborensis TaxID=2116518 RepID=UPI003F4DEA7B
MVDRESFIRSRRDRGRPARISDIAYEGLMPMTVYCGIDWAEVHHGVAIVDDSGGLVARLRIGDAAGYRQLIDLLADAGDNPQQPIPVAIETSRGLLVACLRATGRQIYAINPVAVARYRDRYTVSRTKSDHVDAVVLANILRTDMAVHRPLPNDSELVQAIAVLARAQQDAVWDRTQAHNKLRSLLREYYPTFLLAFRDARGGITRPEARAVLAAALTPTQAATLTSDDLADALRRAGRQRGITAEADRLHQALATATLHQPPLVEQAMGRQALALLRALDTACLNAEDLAAAAEQSFDQHPDAEIITSFAGLGRFVRARWPNRWGDWADSWSCSAGQERGWAAGRGSRSTSCPTA